MKAHRLIHWPAVIHFTGHAELAYVGSQAQWDADGHLHASGYRPADRLIDSSGRIWSLGRGHPHAIPQFSGETASLDTLIALVRAHAAQSGECCVAKLSAASVAEAIRMVKSLDAQ
ncbi:hypothetical protein MTYP_00128 [Methylophilaceae bacterium]|nr:hypothetical protein MTYP_00128 [Methylophilaceae bacterium]